MKNLLIVWSCTLIFFSCTTNTNRIDTKTETSTTTTEPKKTVEQTGDYVITGKEYIGEPTNEKSMSGCEGCGQRGSFKFSVEGNNVGFIWSGSDIMNGGTYEQDGAKLTIASMYGESHVFTVSKDGKEITSVEYETVFRDKNFPWEK